MRKGIIKYLLVGFIIIGVVSFLLYALYTLHHYYSFSEDKTTIYISPIPSNDTLRILMIGDSWAAYHHQNGSDIFLKKLLEANLKTPVHVLSTGMIGAKTKMIYELMHDSISYCGTIKHLQLRPHYCIISAGINDAVAKMGAVNYCHHYTLILKQLIANHITPIIIDIPDVDYLSIYQQESWTSNMRHRISCFLNKTSMWDFDNYRKTIKESLSNNGFESRTIYISAKEWNSQGYKDSRELYQQDHVHLNKRGYQLLDLCIAKHIYEDLIQTSSYYQ